MAAEHPLLTAVVVLVLVVLAVLLIRKLWRFARRLVEPLPPIEGTPEETPEKA